jgi:hypothetical protein
MHMIGNFFVTIGAVHNQVHLPPTTGVKVPLTLCFLGYAISADRWKAHLQESWRDIESLTVNFVSNPLNL